jgi:hypothetical protein
VDYDARANLPCYTQGGRPDYCGPQVFEGMPALLIRNLDRRRFEDVSMEVGLADVPGPGLGILTGDSTPTAG